jgi:tRNA G26 N,N-dimethylase Trm1
LRLDVLKNESGTIIFVSIQTQKLGDVHDLCFYLKALAASGLRALRYAKEVAEVGSVVACDNDKG